MYASTTAIPSAANTDDPPATQPATRSEWDGFAGMLIDWTNSPTYSHTHYLTALEYNAAFNHIFLGVARLRKRIIALTVTDTADGDERDEIILHATQRGTKFKIRPI